MRLTRKDMVIEGGRKLYLYSFSDLDEDANRQAMLWGSVGDAWHDEAKHIEAWFQPVTQAMLSHLPQSASDVIDVGCGAQTIPLPSNWRRIGIDVAAEMKPTVVGDACRLPVQTATASAVMGRFSYIFASDPALAFREAHRALKPGGVFTFSAWGTAAQNAWSSAYNDYMADKVGIRKPEPTDPHAFRLADRSEVTTLLRDAGFAEPQHTEHTLTYFAEADPEDALKLILNLAGPIKTAYAKVPPEQRPQVDGELRELAHRIDRTGHAGVWSAKKPLDNSPNV